MLRLPVGPLAINASAEGLTLEEAAQAATEIREKKRIKALAWHRIRLVFMRYILKDISKPLIVKKNWRARMIRPAAVCGLLSIPMQGRAATLSVLPDADAFVRSMAPSSNFGGGGALSVSGAAAVNGSGEQNGLFDTLMRFSMSNVVSELNEGLGDDWIVTGIRLVVTEMATPDNAIFNIGIGRFEVRWIASDNWSEGSGKPNAPTTDGVTWQDLPAILNSNLDVSLGVFTNTAANTQISNSLSLAESCIADIRSGGELSLYLTAASPDIGFTFNSRNFGNTNAQPYLEVTAMANPKPRIESIVISNKSAVVSFETVSNWNYAVLGADSLSGSWANLLTISAQPTNGHVSFLEDAVRGERFYKLKLSPSTSPGF